jgi:TrmH family RNA methyltransferase
LTKRAFRQRERAFLAEGPQAVGEALAMGSGVTDLFVTAPAQARHADLVASAADAGVAVQVISGEAMSELAQTVTPQGLLAVCGFIDVPLDAITRARPRLVALLANVRDPGNAGTVLRAADAAGADAVIFSDASVDPYNGKCVRASAGSLFHLPVAALSSGAQSSGAQSSGALSSGAQASGGQASGMKASGAQSSGVRSSGSQASGAAQYGAGQSDQVIRLPAVIAELRAAGLRVIAADGRSGVTLDDPAARELLAGPTAWLFGNEAWGLPDDLLALADASVAVPIYGRAESLNLATAAAVCLYASASAQRGTMRAGTV